MIRFIYSESGHEVLECSGISTASLKDPTKEAQKWIELNRAYLDHHVDYIVLGLGTGYHIQALSMAYPDQKIWVIEKNLDVLKVFKNYSPQVRIVHLENIESIETCLDLKKALTSTVRVLRFRPAWGWELEFYQDLQLFLNGRSREGLEFLMKIRGQKIYPTNNMLQNRSEGYSVKDIQKVIENKTTLSREDINWLIQGELVK